MVVDITKHCVSYVIVGSISRPDSLPLIEHSMWLKTTTESQFDCPLSRTPPGEPVLDSCMGTVPDPYP